MTTTNINIGADFSSVSREAESAGKAIDQTAQKSAKSVEKIATGYDKAAAAAERYRKVLLAAERDAANRARKAESETLDMGVLKADIGRQGMALDRRVAAANLALASRQNAPKTLAEKIGAGVDAVGGVLTSKLGALTTVAAAAAMSLSVFKFGLDTMSHASETAGKLSEDMGTRRIQLGHAAASFGLSADEIAKFQTAGGRMTIPQKEALLNSAGAAAKNRPFGIPKLSNKSMMKMLDLGEKTGLDLSSVFSNPAVQDGNLDTFLGMEMTRQGAPITSLSDRRGNGPIRSYNNLLPADTIAEEAFRSGQSGLADAPAKERGNNLEGIKRRVAETYLDKLSNGGAVDVIGSKIYKVMRYFDPEATNSILAGEAGRLDPNIQRQIELLEEANQQRAKTLARPPKPTAQRDRN